MMTNTSHDDLIEQAANILQEEIDWEIMAGMFVNTGWTMIDLPRFHSSKEAIDVVDWIETTCTGKHFNRGKTFVFEKKQDAEWFVLRWQ